MRTKEEVRAFVAKELEDHTTAAHVDIVSIMSPPGPRESVNVAYEINLVPVDAKKGIYLRVATAIRQDRKKQEISLIMVSHRYENTEALMKDTEELFEKIRMQEEALKKQLVLLSAEKAAQENALQEELNKLAAEKDAQERVSETVIGEVRKRAQAEMEKLQKKLEEEIEAVRKQAQSELEILEQKQAERLKLDRAEIRNELTAKQEQVVQGIEEEYRKKEEALQREITIAKEKEDALHQEMKGAEEKIAALLKEKEELEDGARTLSEEKEELNRTLEKERASALALEKKLRDEIEVLVHHADTALQEKERHEEILKQSYGDKMQITGEIGRVVERLKQMLKTAEDKQTEKEKLAMKDMLSMIGALAVEMKPYEKTFSLPDCLRVIEFYAKADCEEKGVRLLPFEKDERLPETVTADKARLQMVLLNLLSFLADKGAKEIRVSVEADRPVRGKVYLRFHIEDDQDVVRELVGPAKEELSYTTTLLGMMGGGIKVQRVEKENAAGEPYGMEGIVTTNLSV
ncbi:MAG: hypothetical protein J5935_07980 [Lachnospiraceae bacterium]|nr:hypothetical protein [Lachnospiraceae bacterium]